MSHSIDQFNPGDAWLAFRAGDAFVQDQPVDLYVLVDVASSYVFGHALALTDMPEEREVAQMMRNAYEMKGVWPKKLFFPPNDPAAELFRRLAEEQNISFEITPLSRFAQIVEELKTSFRQFFSSPKRKAGSVESNTTAADEEKMALSFLPDSYDLCPCASGKKYKFCCKLILKDITHAMVATEDGKLKEALSWMNKAKEKVGETPEVLCRYAIVYSSCDKIRADEYLGKCLRIAPHHPRANYILGINLKESGEIEGAIDAYKIAIKNYPATDRYHLNEVWNNLGTVYYEMGKIAEAKAAWEKALVYLPEDPITIENLNTFIYDNPSIPTGIKGSQSIH